MAKRTEWRLLGALAALIVLLATWNLTSYPRTWYDEGWWLQIPRNVAEQGVYASRSSEGFRYGDTIVSASPAFFLPTAAAFSVFGVGLLQARLVIVAWFLVACALTWLVGRRAFGAAAALLGTALFVLIKPDDELTSALVLGRHVMAEIPSLCWLLLGVLGCQRIDQSPKPQRAAALAGLAFGFTMAIKSQFAAPLWATIVLVGLIDRYVGGRRRTGLFLTMLGVSAMVVLLHAVGIYLSLSEPQLAIFLDDYRATGQAVAGAIWSSTARWNALAFLARSEYAWFVVAATAYTWVQQWRQRPALDLGVVVMCAFVTVWLGWFMIASVGWARYAFPAIAIGHLLVAKLLIDLAGIEETAQPSSTRGGLPAGRVRVRGRAAAVALLVAVMIVGTSRQVLAGIFTSTNRDAFRIAAFIDEHVPATDRIETWEWEVVFLSQTTSFHVPPTRMLPPLMARKQLDHQLHGNSYVVNPTDTRYLLVGPFAIWTGFYGEGDPSTGGATLLRREGLYSLYALDPGARPADDIPAPAQ